MSNSVYSLGGVRGRHIEKIMFNNIDTKIKKLAKICIYAGVIGGAFAFLGVILYFLNAQYIIFAPFSGSGTPVLFADSAKLSLANRAYLGLIMLKYGLLTTIAGLFSSLTLYGFGELIEKVSIIADQVKK